jgi:hypothetical protein
MGRGLSSHKPRQPEHWHGAVDETPAAHGETRLPLFVVLRRALQIARQLHVGPGVTVSGQWSGCSSPDSELLLRVGGFPVLGGRYCGRVHAASRGGRCGVYLSRSLTWPRPLLPGSRAR